MRIAFSNLVLTCINAFHEDTLVHVKKKTLTLSFIPDFKLIAYYLGKIAQ